MLRLLEKQLKSVTPASVPQTTHTLRWAVEVPHTHTDQYGRGRGEGRGSTCFPVRQCARAATCRTKWRHGDLVDHFLPIGLHHLKHHVILEVLNELQHPLAQGEAAGEQSAVVGHPSGLSADPRVAQQALHPLALEQMPERQRVAQLTRAGGDSRGWRVAVSWERKGLGGTSDVKREKIRKGRRVRKAA